jgi:hypothetical protein
MRPWRRPRGLGCALAAALACGSAVAQEMDDLRHDGTWTATTRCGAAACDVRVVVANFEGTWQDVSRKPAARRLCRGKPVPLTVQRSDASQFVFTVWGSSLAADCPDLTVRTKPTGPARLEGTLQEGLHGSETPAQHAAHAGASAASSVAGGAEAPPRNGAVPLALVRRGAPAAVDAPRRRP